MVDLDQVGVAPLWVRVGERDRETDVSEKVGVGVGVCVVGVGDSVNTEADMLGVRVGGDTEGLRVELRVKPGELVPVGDWVWDMDTVDKLQLLVHDRDPVGGVCVLVHVLVCVFRCVGVVVALWVGGLGVWVRDCSMDRESVREKDTEGRVPVCGTVLVVGVVEGEAVRDGADADRLRVTDWEGVLVGDCEKLPKVAVVRDGVGVADGLGGVCVTDCVQVLVLTGVQDRVPE
mmetsp:Transcript_92339/g.160042  ORF Transcript_92339/g.160042 Transcript_92339/m.160042 type:complete len:232 (+) Transcript_92339:1022-1717(+)